MRKVIAIGELNQDITYRNNIPVSSVMGGRIMNMASSLAVSGIPVYAVSECGVDGIGDMVIKFLTGHGVDVRSVDRYTDGETPLSVIIDDDSGDVPVISYGRYPSDRFDVVWPRIDEDDIVVFGSFYSVDPSLRERLFEMITYAAGRKAIIVYLPGFRNRMNLRITKVMTAILENLEISNIVIGHQQEMKWIFGEEDPGKLYKDRIAFYTPSYLHLDNNATLSLFSPLQKKTVQGNIVNLYDELGWDSGFYAGIIYGILNNDIKYNDIDRISVSEWDDIIETAYAFAGNASANADNSVSADFVKNKFR